MAILFRKNAKCWLRSLGINGLRFNGKRVKIKCYSSWYRALRRKRFLWEVKERETPDALDKALIRAKAKKEEGLIDAPTYYIIEDKIKSLKKLIFTEDYERMQDKDMYEWMKYKVAAEVGGEE